jgi:hypothetical protein
MNCASFNDVLMQNNQNTKQRWGNLGESCAKLTENHQ